MKQTIFVTMLATLLMVTSCSNQNVNAEKHQEISTWMVGDINYAVFTFDGVDDLIWNPDDGCYFIEYNDDDAFDLTTLAEMTGRVEWYGDYIVIDIDENLLEEFIEDWEMYKETHDYTRYDISERWCIQETWVYFEDGTKDVRFEILHQSWESTIEY